MASQETARLTRGMSSMTGRDHYAAVARTLDKKSEEERRRYWESVGPEAKEEFDRVMKSELVLHAGKLEKQSILGLWQTRYFQIVRTMGEWYLVYYKNQTDGYEYEKQKDADLNATIDIKRTKLNFKRISLIEHERRSAKITIRLNGETPQTGQIRYNLRAKNVAAAKEWTQKLRSFQTDSQNIGSSLNRGSPSPRKKLDFGGSAEEADDPEYEPFDGSNGGIS
eukprot:CAMPEP_0119528086 /NCGR_PEP_ID=MMETSP1344-20130328/42364_1 /TAXON_ID=236787 /ORGANISM="Florenciella parvula, Strain CCMP2471" /LENGTH=223 /DNA_ID=CAMNT_0007567407 /DNA_START=26 /DNA_END=693 /DNA_ORIENTATION=+